MKPTHMIGGYAQFSYRLQLLRTVGSNRDQFVLLAQDGHGRLGPTSRGGFETAPCRHVTNRHSAGAATGVREGEAMRSARNRDGDEPRQVHSTVTPARSTCKNVWTIAKARNTPGTTPSQTKPGIGYPKDRENQDRWGRAAGCARPTVRFVPRQGGKWSLLMKIFANPYLPQIDYYYETPFTYDYAHLHEAPRNEDHADARPRSLTPASACRRSSGGPNGEEILRRARFEKRSKDRNFDDIPEGDVRAVPEHLHDVRSRASANTA